MEEIFNWQKSRPTRYRRVTKVDKPMGLNSDMAAASKEGGDQRKGGIHVDYTRYFLLFPSFSKISFWPSR